MTEKRYYMSGNTKKVQDYGSGFYDNKSDSLFPLSYKEVCDLLNENEQLKNRVDELEDDNIKYTLSTDKLEGYTKRFMPTKCINEFRDCKTNRYYWLDNEDNFTGTLELLNLLDCKNEQLKKENKELKNELGLFKHFIEIIPLGYGDIDD